MTTTLSPGGGPALTGAAVRHRPIRQAATGTVRVVGRGIAVLLPVLLITTFLTFLLGSLTGQDPAASVLGDNARPEDVARMRGVFGLDRPLIVRYVDWLWDALHGDLGSSWFTHIPVADSVAQRLPVSLSIAVFALLLGTIARRDARHRRRPQRRRDPRPRHHAAGVGALHDPRVRRRHRAHRGPVGRVPGLPVRRLRPAERRRGLWLKCLTLPAIALSLDTSADLARQLRTGLAAALQENYVVGATMRGFTRRRIVTVHALRNGAGPAVALLGMHVPKLVGGAVIVETVFMLPGLGALTKEAALRGDVPVVQGTLLVTVVLVVASSVLFNALLYVLRPTARREV